MKMSRQFPLNALRVFDVAARYLSFTKAGDELGMTQTAVSYQIRLLEEHIGEELFIRRPRQLALTETGARLLPKVSEAFGLMADAVQDAKRSANETLEIHSFPTFASKWLARNLGNFQLRHPHIAVRLLPTPEKSPFMKDGADVALLSEQLPPRDDLVQHPLMNMKFSPMLSPALAESIGGVHSPEDLLKLPLISPGEDWREWFDEAGIGGPQTATHSLSTFGIQDLGAIAAIEGQGVAMLNTFLFRDELASGRLVQPFDIVLPGTWPLWLVYPQARRNAGKIRAFHAWIVEMLPQNPISGA